MFVRITIYAILKLWVIPMLEHKTYFIYFTELKGVSKPDLVGKEEMTLDSSFKQRNLSFFTFFSG